MAGKHPAAFSELLPPAGITAAVAAFFTRPVASEPHPELVVCRAHVLEVWSVVRGGERAPGGGDAPPCLQLDATFSLPGRVESAAVLRRRSGAPRTQRDALLLTTREAKLSVVRWDPSTRQLAASSLHSWEGHTPGAEAPRPPRALTDPEGRCAAVLLGTTASVALLPAASSGGNEGVGGGGAPASAASLSPAWLLDLRSKGVRRVRDAAFLHGFAEPVLLVLHESGLTWAGRLATKRDTTALAAFSISLSTRRATRIWGEEALPFDCGRVEGVPLPLCGALILGASFALYRSPNGASATLALCPSALGTAPEAPGGGEEEAAAPPAWLRPARAAHAPALPASANPPPAVAAHPHCTLCQLPGISLAGARVCWPLDGLCSPALVAPSTGTPLEMHLHLAGRHVTRLELRLLGGDGGAGDASVFHTLRNTSVLPASLPPWPAAAVPLGAGVVAVCGRGGEAVLVDALYAPPKSVTLSLEAAPPHAPGLGVDAAAHAPGALKRPRAPSNGGGDEAAEDDIDDAEDELLYGGGGGGNGVVDTAGEAMLSHPASLSAPSPPPALESGPLSLAPGGALRLSPLDSLPSWSPCHAAAVGEAWPSPVEAAAAPLGAPPAPRAELLLSTGVGASSALLCLHRGVAPSLVACVPLPGVTGAWPLPSSRRPASAPPDWLLLSHGNSTLVLDASGGDELADATGRAEFVSDQPTLAAGPLFGGARAAQVTPRGGIRLCAGPVKAQDLSLAALAAPDGASALSACVDHPFVLLRLSDGTLRVAAGRDDTNRVEALPLPQPLSSASFTAATLFADATGALAAASGLAPSGAPSLLSSHAPAPRHFLAAATPDGRLSLYALPSGSRIFVACGASAGAILLCGSPGSASLAGGEDAAADPAAPPPPPLSELRLDVFPGFHPSVLLTACRADGEVFAWRAFAAPRTPFAPPASPGAVCELRFARYPLTWTPGPGGPLASPPGAPGPHPPRLARIARVRPPPRPTEPTQINDDDNEHSFASAAAAAAGGEVAGVFVGGSHPHFLVASRGWIHAHPLSLGAGTGGVAACAPFHNPNCPHGILFATPSGGGGAGGALRIATLPRGVAYERGWSVRRAPCGGGGSPDAPPASAPLPLASASPERVTCLAYDPEARAYVAGVTVRRPFRPRTGIEEGDIAGAAAAAAAEARAASEGGFEDAAELRLLAPGSLAAVFTLVLEPGESVMCVCPLPLRDASTGEVRHVVAVGTAFVAGEETPCRGRLLLVAPAAAHASGAGATLLHDKAFKSAVTSLCPLEGQHKGLLLAAVGSKLGVHAWGGRDLVCVAFYDSPHFTTALASVKNFALLGDVQKGLVFLRWKDAPTERVLQQLSKTFENLDIAAAELLIDGPSLAAVAADGRGGLHAYAFAPGEAAAWMGQKLLPVARFATGGDAHTAAVRLRCAGGAASSAPRSGVLLPTCKGALHAVCPVDEPGFGPLASLGRAVAALLPQPAGLHPLAWRRVAHRSGRTPLDDVDASLLDGDLLARFLAAPWGVQHALAAEAGAPRAALLVAARQAGAGAAWFV